MKRNRWKSPLWESDDSEALWLLSWSAPVIMFDAFGAVIPFQMHA